MDRCSQAEPHHCVSEASIKVFLRHQLQKHNRSAFLEMMIFFLLVHLGPVVPTCWCFYGRHFESAVVAFWISVKLIFFFDVVIIWKLYWISRVLWGFFLLPRHSWCEDVRSRAEMLLSWPWMMSSRNKIFFVFFFLEKLGQGLSIVATQWMSCTYKNQKAKNKSIKKTQHQILQLVCLFLAAAHYCSSFCWLLRPASWSCLRNASTWFTTWMRWYWFNSEQDSE